MDKLDEIFDLYLKYGNKNYIGEDLSQMEHAQQAALLAENDTNNKEIILGAFLHDIGHLLAFDNPDLENMGNLGVMNHEKVGGDYLRKNGFPELTCVMVENHVNTKRYLISKNDEYYNNLSEASKQTFNYQGGKMSNQEMIEFESSKYFHNNIKLREYDDLAKDINLKINDPEYVINIYKNMAREILQCS